MPPKPRPTQYEVKLPPLRIFIDDLERVQRAVQDAATGKVTLHSDEHDLDEAGDMQSLPWIREIWMYIPIKSENVTLSLERTSARVSCRSLDPAVRGTVEKIVDLLRPRRRLGAAILAKLCLPLAFTISLGLGALIGMGDVPKSMALGYAGYVAFSAPAVAWGGFIHFGRWTVIETRRSSEFSTFVQRKGDDLIVGFLLAACSFLLGLVVGRLS